MIKCHLHNGLAGAPPALDALLVYELAFKMGLKDSVTRATPSEKIPWIPIPIESKKLDRFTIHKTSSPIFKSCATSVEYYNKRIDFSAQEYYSDDSRKSVLTASGPYKMKRIPITIYLTDLIVWFCVGDKGEIKKLLKRIHSIGRLKKMGYGMIDSWEVEESENDFSWFADSPAGKILMRPLPVGDIPKDVTGWRKDYGAPTHPYWHPSRYCEIGVPC